MRNALARPRVVSFSSYVARYDGHLNDQNHAGVAQNKMPQRLILDLATRGVQNALVHEFQC